MQESIKREIHAYTPRGERVFLGHSDMTNDEAQEFLNNIATIYGNPDASGWFNVKSSVFDVRAFAGVQILPPNKP